MASVLFQNALLLTFGGTIDWDTDNFDALLLENTTTVDTEPEADTVVDFTTLAESTATDYAHEDVTTPAISADDALDALKFTSDNWVWGNGTPLGGDAATDYQGALLVKYVDGGTADIPLLFVDFTADVTLTATEVTAPAPANGYLNIGQPA